MVTELLVNPPKYREMFLHNYDFFKTKYTFSSTVAVALAVIAVVVTILFFARRKPKGCLDRENFKEFKLVNRTKVSHNTDRICFALPTPQSVLGLPVGQHIRCRGKDDQGQEVVRPYTPITLDLTAGYFEILVKGRFKYRPGQARAFGMLAGGTGITPMFQVTRAILENRKDQTKLHLIYANNTVDDILLKEEIDSFARKHPQRFKVYYVVTKPPPNWTAGIGRISKKMIREHCPKPDPNIMILRCGPPVMNKAMAAYLNELGYTPNMQFEF